MIPQPSIMEKPHPWYFIIASSSFCCRFCNILYALMPKTAPLDGKEETLVRAMLRPRVLKYSSRQNEMYKASTCCPTKNRTCICIII